MKHLFRNSLNYLRVNKIRVTTVFDVLFIINAIIIIIVVVVYVTVIYSQFLNKYPGKYVPNRKNSGRKHKTGFHKILQVLYHCCHC